MDPIGRLEEIIKESLAFGFSKKIGIIINEGIILKG